MTGLLHSRSTGLATAFALALAPAVAEAAAAPVVCPDAATVQAARLVEFQTMMMGVAVRCRYVGVPVGDHLDGMTAARRTMFAEANDRVAAYLRSLNTRPALGTPPPVAAASAPPPAAPAKPPVVRPTAAKAGPGKRAAASTATAAARKPALATAAPAPVPPARPAARISRRTDPFDRYLTMIGNQYGGGITTPQRCKAFDAIVLSLGDKTNTDRLLTMVSSSLVQATLLEAIVNCPAGKP